METIKLYAFSAPKEPRLCDEFLREHRKVLEDFGISQVTTNNDRWTKDPNTYVIVALHPQQGMVGGIRLQIQSDEPLPMEEALRKLDPRIVNVLHGLKSYGNGEVCGLWNANRYANHGIPILLSKAVTAISVMANARRMVCLVAHYTQRHPRRNGFIVIEGVGDTGKFSYPIPSITAIAMVNPDTMILEHATDEQRQQIFSLRLRPEQERVEYSGGEPILVQYDLRVNSNVLDLHAYQSIKTERMRYSA
ncbi:MAG: hypothetical protein H6595_10615 [Flavobacteriales bacterium]|nr:hypothetical protein [Flavobacteriales bacterium]MCB9167914.1 hypothetical protein [Flavobacteriales bacterium]